MVVREHHLEVSPADTRHASRHVSSQCPVPAPARPVAGVLSAAAILELQRSTGNEAVGQLLSTPRRRTGISGNSIAERLAPSVQRAPRKSAKWQKSSYVLTEADKELLASQTEKERIQDKARLSKVRARLAALEKARKKRRLSDSEAKELADLQALRKRVNAAQRALKRKDVEEILAAAGHTVSEWYGDIQVATFLNLSLPVHRALAARLALAEKALIANPDINQKKLEGAELGTELGMYSAGSMRKPKPAAGGSRMSLHTFGLAVDLNYRGNPFVGLSGKKITSRIVKRATSLVDGSPIELMEPLARDVAYATLTRASKALSTYLSYRTPGNRAALTRQVSRHTPAQGEPGDVDGWLAQLEKDYESLHHGKAAKDFVAHKLPEEGFIDLNEQVVLELTRAGLTWGGTYAGAKDIMHFDLRTGEGAKVETARRSHHPNA